MSWKSAWSSAFHRGSDVLHPPPARITWHQQASISSPKPDNLAGVCVKGTLPHAVRQPQEGSRTVTTGAVNVAAIDGHAHA